MIEVRLILDNTISEVASRKKFSLSDLELECITHTAALPTKNSYLVANNQMYYVVDPIFVGDHDFVILKVRKQ